MCKHKPDCYTQAESKPNTQFPPAATQGRQGDPENRVRLSQEVLLGACYHSAICRTSRKVLPPNHEEGQQGLVPKWSKESKGILFNAHTEKRLLLVTTRHPCREQ